MSVGHVARAFETAGIATVIIAVKAFEARMKMMALPRVLLTHELMGRPLGEPFNEAKHRDILRAGLDLLIEAKANGTIKNYQVPTE